ncbi:MAG: DUF2812 domain-containing protein [Firmicutes bacterium]|nr:DUF2812 domain-containing protein [Bacillota bacterium]
MRLFDIKIKISDFSFYDKTGIEQYLEKQAEKGGFLDMIVWDVWRFRKGEPKKVSYKVTYFPKSSWFGPEPTAEIEEFKDFCEHTGWEHAATNSQMQVFRNEKEEPIMIETDPEIELKKIHDSVMGWYMGSLFLVAALCVFGLFLPLMSLIQSPMSVLGNPKRLINLLIWMDLLIYCAVEIGAYFKWWGKAAAAVERGQELPKTKGHRIFSILAVIFALILLVAHNVVTSESGEFVLKEFLPIAAYFVGFMCISIAVHFLTRYMQKKHFPKGVTITIGYIIAVIFIVILQFLFL